MPTVNALIFTDMASIPFCRASGAYRIATELRKAGYVVQVVDHFLLLGLERTLALIDKFVGTNTLMVGFSTTFMNMQIEYLHRPDEIVKRFTPNLKLINRGRIDSMFSIGLPLSHEDLQAIKDRVLSKSPTAKFVLGGTKADYQVQTEMDAFIVGYADTSVVQYMKYLEGKNPLFQCNHTPDGRLVIDDDPDAVGFDFANSIIEWQDSDCIEPNEVLSIEVSRGCIFRCKFCAFRLNGKSKMDYLKSSVVLRAELMRNYEKFGTTKYVFTDDTYNDSVEKISRLRDVFVSLPFKLEFVAYLRLDLLNRFREQADILKESGLKAGIFGIETLHYPAAKIIGKGLSPDKVRETLTWLRDDKGWGGNIMTTGSFIVGLPTETIETAEKWIAEILDFSYPLDGLRLYGLGIDRSNKRYGKSEFDLNHVNYGYKFDSQGWYNDNMNETTAVQIAMDALVYSIESGRGKSPGFQSMQLQNYGYTWSQLHENPFFAIKINGVDSTELMVEKYYQKVNAL